MGEKKQDLAIVDGLTQNVENSNVTSLETHKKNRESGSGETEFVELNSKLEIPDNGSDIVELIENHLEHHDLGEETYRKADIVPEQGEQVSKNNGPKPVDTQSGSHVHDSIDAIEEKILQHIELAKQIPEPVNEEKELDLAILSAATGKVEEGQPEVVQSNHTQVYETRQNVQPPLLSHRHSESIKQPHVKELEYTAAVNEMPRKAKNVSPPEQVDSNKVSYTSELDQQRDLYHLNRFLHDRDKPEQKLSTKLVLALCALLSIIGGVIGAYVAINTGSNSTVVTVASEQDPLIEEYMTSEQFSKPVVAEYVKTSEEQTSSMLHTKGDSEERASSFKKGGGSPGKSAALIAAPLTKSVEQCHEPKVKMTAVRGGLTNIHIKVAECDKGQNVQLRYADMVYKPELNEQGELNFVLDCFAGDKFPVEIIVGERAKIVRQPVTSDLEIVSKVAVIWSGNVNFDLHAFQYTQAQHAQKHVWEKTPSSFDHAYNFTQMTGAGHGFLTHYKAASSEGKNIEVYTFFHSDEAEKRIIKMALGYRQQGNKILKQVNCQPDQVSMIDYMATRLMKNQSYEKSQSAASVNNCSLRTASRQKLNSKAVQDLVIND